jgi:hypothetical protein
VLFPSPVNGNAHLWPGDRQLGGAHFAPEEVLSFGHGEVCASSTAMSFFSDAPEKVRIEIERDGAAFRRCSLPATSRSSGEVSVSFL